jgi:hypothetical protein
MKLEVLKFCLLVVDVALLSISITLELKHRKRRDK